MVPPRSDRPDSDSMVSICSFRVSQPLRRIAFKSKQIVTLRLISMATDSAAFTRLMGEAELQNILSTIGAGLVSGGFMPQGNIPGLYVYKKKKRPSILITLILLLLFIIPGLIYLILGWEEKVISIRVTELPINIQIDRGETIRMPVCLAFSTDAPAAIRREVARILSPYSVDVDRMIKNPETVLVGRTLEKKVEVECDYCSRKQTVSLPFSIERVEGDRGYGQGGSITVTCSNPNCQKPFEVEWDQVIVELEFRS
jgi:hypothetical protein